jgi:hypothetical protein
MASDCCCCCYQTPHDEHEVKVIITQAFAAVPVISDVDEPGHMTFSATSSNMRPLCARSRSLRHLHHHQKPSTSSSFHRKFCTQCSWTAPCINPFSTPSKPFTTNASPFSHNTGVSWLSLTNARPTRLQITWQFHLRQYKRRATAGCLCPPLVVASSNFVSIHCVTQK